MFFESQCSGESVIRCSFGVLTVSRCPYLDLDTWNLDLDSEGMLEALQRPQDPQDLPTHLREVIDITDDRDHESLNPKTRH